jgi:hypothetical protein
MRNHPPVSSKQKIRPQPVRKARQNLSIGPILYQAEGKVKRKGTVFCTKQRVFFHIYRIEGTVTAACE